jgi:hypothetical protein
VSANADLSFGELQARAAVLTPDPMAGGEQARALTPSRDSALSELVDETLEDSFPASDPPSWTTSVVRLASAEATGAGARDRGVLRRAWCRAAALF